MFRISLALSIALLAGSAIATTAEAKGGGGQWTSYLAKLGTQPSTSQNTDDCAERRREIAYARDRARAREKAEAAARAHELALTRNATAKITVCLLYTSPSPRD